MNFRKCRLEMMKKLLLSAAMLGVCVILPGCAPALTEAGYDAYHDASVQVLGYSRGCLDNDTAEESGSSYKAQGTVYLENSDNMVLQNAAAEETAAMTAEGTIEGLEECILQEVELLPEMSVEWPIADNWPESIRCVSDGMNAEPLQFDFQVEEPMEISVSCLKKSGKIDMEIIDSDGVVSFNEKNIQTEDYTFSADKPGTYTVFLWVKRFYGEFTMKPLE